MNKLKTGVKHDTGKVDYTILQWNALEQVAGLAEFGAAKYERDNYLMLSPHRTLQSAMRHLVAYMKDPSAVDDETGSSHLIHAAWEVLATLEIELRSTHGEDFRFNRQSIIDELGKKEHPK